ncbi:hypothetical protein C7H79_00405 [Nitrosomonas supralitoralis]|uniref:Uncharacterized protein n=1 Tax=Nitrosomonas supralitoralis TaxID=2116706 RepID=A0A2P7NZM9_9PROT|nr:hypothetical protein C7H79_00405 [Nitrosomonas supralitoralis]
MSVASGIVHKEFHDRDIAQRDGLFEIVRPWMNLPAKDRISPARYQNILNNRIPISKLPDDQGSVRVYTVQRSASNQLPAVKAESQGTWNRSDALKIIHTYA